MVRELQKKCQCNELHRLFGDNFVSCRCGVCVEAILVSKNELVRENWGLRNKEQDMITETDAQYVADLVVAKMRQEIIQERLAEREECARLAEGIGECEKVDDTNFGLVGRLVARKIREKSKGDTP